MALLEEREDIVRLLVKGLDTFCISTHALFGDKKHPLCRPCAFWVLYFLLHFVYRDGFIL